MTSASITVQSPGDSSLPQSGDTLVASMEVLSARLSKRLRIHSMLRSCSCCTRPTDRFSARAIAAVDMPWSYFIAITVASVEVEPRRTPAGSGPTATTGVSREG